MESLSSTLVYDFPPATLNDVRKLFDLDKLGRMDEAIDVLETWVQKQSHFVKKDFSRDYLERCIISCKGSVEKAKQSLDRLCTFRSLIPRSYGDADVNELSIVTDAMSVGLPKFAPGYHRVFLTRCSLKQPDAKLVNDFYKYSLSLCDYLRALDYCNGMIVILDYRDLNLVNFVANINPMELRLMLTMFIEGYKLRIRGIHIVTNSKMVDLLVKLLRQIVSPKIRDRLQVHRSVEGLFEVVPREILPAEYGGEEKSLAELQKDWCTVLSSKEHKDFMQQMSLSVTDESCRHKALSDDYMGMPGTFRSLVID